MYVCIYVCMYVYMHVWDVCMGCMYICMYVYISVYDKLIWCTIGPKSFLFGTLHFFVWASGAVNYDYIVTNSINSLLIGSRCILNGAHTNHF